MKIKITILLIISLFIGANLFAQTDDQGGVSTSYDRLSISTFFIEPLDSISEKTVNRMKNLPISNKFDSHNIDISLFKIKLNHRNDNSESENISLLNNSLSEVSKDVIAKWFNRSATGDFNMELIQQKGLNNATDNSMVVAGGSQLGDNVVKDAGEKLINKTYAIIYDINVKNMKQVYDEQDAKAKQTDPNAAPVERLNEGYQASYTAYLFKIDFNDSISNSFYNEYWSDASNHNEAKVEKFKSALFPYKYVSRYSSSVSSSQVKKPTTDLEKAYRRTMPQLLDGIANKINKEAIEKLTGNNESLLFVSGVSNYKIFYDEKVLFLH